jgi:hypothetical protein
MMYSSEIHTTQEIVNYIK